MGVALPSLAILAETQNLEAQHLPVPFFIFLYSFLLLWFFFLLFLFCSGKSSMAQEPSPALRNGTGLI